MDATTVLQTPIHQMTTEQKIKLYDYTLFSQVDSND